MSKNFNLTLTAISSAVVLSCQPIPAFAQLTEAKASDVALKQIGAYSAWNRGFTGKGSRIAFVDTGADLKHSDLKNVVASYSAYGPISDKNFGHGTNMISLAAGAKNDVGVIGVAYDASVLAYAGGKDGNLNINDVSNGIIWSANNKADVINLSLGFSMSKTAFDSGYSLISTGVYRAKTVTDPYSNTALLPALQTATGKGSIVVIAAGNDGNATPMSPANLAIKTDSAGRLLLGGQAVIVGAVDSKNVISSFSNRAGHICQNVVGTACADKVQIKDYFLVAPGGTAVWGASANTGTNITSSVGTSAAAAYVSGSVGLIKQAWPTLKSAEIVQILLKTATDLGAPGVDTIYGNGLVNLDKATNPVGTLALAKVGGTAPAQGKAAIASTSLAVGTIGAQSFKNSVVLRNAQGVDTFGRNYGVDLSAALVSTGASSYNSATAYSNLSTGELKSVSFDTGSFTTSVYTSDNIGGAKVERHFSDGVTAGFELGTASERGSVLGIAGTGALATGDSSTTWKTIHLSRSFSGSTTIYGSAAFADSAAKTASDSMIAAISAIKSQSFTVGISQQNLLKDNDRLNFQVTELPHITSGTMTLSGVTGYSYSNVTEDGAIATPTVATESVNLSSSYRRYATGLSYSQPTGKHSRLVSGAQLFSDNAGGEIRSMVYAKFNMEF